jgi:peptide/nickel transport system permease protein
MRAVEGTHRSPAGVRAVGRKLATTVGIVWRPREGKIGLILLVILAFMLALGPSLAPYDPIEIGVGPSLAGPSFEHLLGTDNLGRDVLSRLLAGGRSVVLAPLLGTMLGFFIGCFVGMLLGYAGGTVDTFATRAIDVFLSVPPLLLVLVILSTAGGSMPILVVCVAVVYIPRVARVVRGSTRPVAVREYVQAAQARGESSLTIVWHEIMPNIVPTLFVEFASRLSWAIIFIATLNFLGFGLQPPSPNWAVMVSESRGTIAVEPLATMAPALAIGSIAVAIGLIADAVTQEVGPVNYRRSKS